MSKKKSNPGPPDCKVLPAPPPAPPSKGRALKEHWYNKQTEGYTEEELDGMYKFGWAPGGYTFRCRDCKDPKDNIPINGPIGAKRCVRCKECALKAYKLWLSKIDDFTEYRRCQQFIFDYEQRKVERDLKKVVNEIIKEATQTSDLGPTEDLVDKYTQIIYDVFISKTKSLK